MFLVSNLVLSTMCAPSHHKMCPTFAVHDNEGAHNHFPLLPASLIEPLYDRLIQVQRITAKDMTPFICHWRWPRSIWTQIRNRSGSMFFPLTRYCLMNKIALSVVFKSSRSACKKRSRRRCRKLFFLKRLAVITFVTALPLTCWGLDITLSTCGSGQVSAPPWNFSGTKIWKLPWNTRSYPNAVPSQWGAYLMKWKNSFTP